MQAGVFYTGKICGIHDFEEDSQHGHVHLILRGPVAFTDEHGPTIRIADPTLLFLPRPQPHRLVADDSQGARVLCAKVRFGGNNQNPVSDSLPSVLQIPLADLRGIDCLLQFVQQESADGGQGAEASLNCLCEVLMIQVLRYCLHRGLTSGGALAGLSDPRLCKALSAIHKEPTHPWDLAEMAGVAGMSRSRFAAHFRAVTGQTPGDYLAGWRITVAQNLLKSGRGMKHVSVEAGYGSSSAFTRAFTRKVGLPPGEWLKRQEGGPAEGSAADSGASPPSRPPAP